MLGFIFILYLSIALLVTLIASVKLLVKQSKEWLKDRNEPVLRGCCIFLALIATVIAVYNGLWLYYSVPEKIITLIPDHMYPELDGAMFILIKMLILFPLWPANVPLLVLLAALGLRVVIRKRILNSSI